MLTLRRKCDEPTRFRVEAQISEDQRSWQSFLRAARTVYVYPARLTPVLRHPTMDRLHLSDALRPNPREPRDRDG
jgi:hypothetical protein